MPRKMRLLAAVVEDRQHLDRAVMRIDQVRRHGVELDRLPGVHHDRPGAELKPSNPAEHGEPFIPGVHLWRGGLTLFRDAHLRDRHTAPIALSRQYPVGRPVHRLRLGTNNDVVGALGLDKLIQ